MVDCYDVAVVGGGVVGLALLRRFTLDGRRCVLLERGRDIVAGASKGNSGLLHTGFDAPHGSLELACMRAGYAEYHDIHERLNLPIDASSALVIAWNEAEREALAGIVGKAHANGVDDVHLLSGDALRRTEPRLAPHALAAVCVPGESIVDPWSTCFAYARQALAHGATIQRSCEVIGGDFKQGCWHLDTARGPVRARAVLNAAGNFGDLVEGIARPAPFEVLPRKGQFVVFDKPASDLVNAIILPVPTKRTKGVALFRTVFGNLAIGPTAEDQAEREVASCDGVTLRMLQAKACEMLPALFSVGVNAVYAGIRPATNQPDYVIEALPQLHWVTVAGIRSTGLTASLGIARHVAGLYAEHFEPVTTPPRQVIWPRMPNLAESRPRPWQSGGEIVCHCERVTHEEILQAIQGPEAETALRAVDLAGVKRRTRATMGRCQGFYCSAKVAAMLRAPPALAYARPPEGVQGDLGRPGVFLRESHGGL